jgi:hypothetical protein
VDGFGPGVRFALASLAVWRVTHLLSAEDGPGDLILNLRARLGTSFVGELMDCFNCTSVWVAVPFTVAVTRSRRSAPLVWLALSGSASLLERATVRGEESAPALLGVEGPA